MNWTEGALNRHSRRKGWNPDVARQRQYFAKARLRAQQPAVSNSSDTQSTPFVPNYISQPNKTSHQAPPMETSHPRPKASRPSSRKRLAYLLNSPTPPLVDKGHSKGVPSPGEPLGHGRSEFPLCGEKQDIQGKRRKLLEKSDWSGIEFQKPLIVDYAPGVSRKGPGASQKQHKSDDDHCRNQLIRRHGDHPHKDQEMDGRQGHGHEPIHLRIGSQSLRWSQDGNTPVRGQRHRLFDNVSPDLDMADSTIAQVGATWALDHQAETSEVRPITPGVSEALETARSPAQRSPPPQQGANSELLGPGEVVCQLDEVSTNDNEGDDHHQGIQPPCRNESLLALASDASIPTCGKQGGDSEVSRIPAAGVRDLIESSDNPPTEAPDTQGVMEPLAQNQPASINMCDGLGSVRRPTMEDDEDEVWRKFLSDDDGTEVARTAGQDAMAAARGELRRQGEAMAGDMAEHPSSVLADSTPMTLLEARELPWDPPTTPMPTTTMNSIRPSATPTNTGTSVAAVQGSPDLTENQPQKQPSTEHRFHQPRPFVGRLSSTGNATRPPHAPLRRGKGRPRKTPDHRRPDVREIPNFEGDPIESEDGDV
ncbi:hypothetical protein ACRE_041590 [Hapsidospora chrysogenum ATCC 11550]|uniref:Uncharacterized protein n=1 Tax=Hapsidospora chrysogenum (strain ATCC 11550 / CBS 779.69 / DSM 880 / IAM 14645 / JCM 23072 / IMI 49137) TaxID=857340 RepID=A0A086T6W1_HAPC1|nr:hypothetical protein ACRE_041590 [Hapsidospora chrysogenum ATCC 11550]